MSRILTTVAGVTLLASAALAADSYETALTNALRGYTSHHEVPVESIRDIANRYDRTFSSVFRDLKFIEEQTMGVSAPAPAPAPAPVYTAPEPVRAPEPMAAPMSYGGDDLLPPNPQPGHCYARLLVPATYSTEYRQVLKSQGVEKVVVKPPRFQSVQKTVLVREAGTRYKVIEPKYTWTEEQVEVRPASTKLVSVPAEYRTETEQILEAPARYEWKKGSGPFEKINNATGEIMCLVEIPAKYRTVTKKVLVSPATVKEVTVPAQYKTVKRKVLAEPGRVEPVEIPAEYDTITVTEMVEPATYDRQVAPDQYQKVPVRTLTSPAHMEWREILCETNLNSAAIGRVQRALKAKGYDPGPADGYIGTKTKAAIKAFQRDNGLAQGNLTFETVRSLGLRVNNGSLL